MITPPLLPAGAPLPDMSNSGFDEYFLHHDAKPLRTSMTAAT